MLFPSFSIEQYRQPLVFDAPFVCHSFLIFFQFLLLMTYRSQFSLSKIWVKLSPDALLLKSTSFELGASHALFLFSFFSNPHCRGFAILWCMYHSRIEKALCRHHFSLVAWGLKCKSLEPGMNPWSIRTGRVKRFLTKYNQRYNKDTLQLKNHFAVISCILPVYWN
jgi:hypothetical protein